MTDHHEEIDRAALEELAALLALDESHRAGTLERLHTRSPELAAIVRRLLERVDASDLTDDSQRTGAAAGLHFGAWQVLARIGHGGMGEVFLAERADGAYVQQAAIKRIWTNLGSLGKRFRRERQILARLQHPNIARLLDGGITGQGHPWFAMELVDGASIIAWADARRLSVRERVALFRSACDALAFAHRNLVVHRDIKPGNVLVDSEGRVRVLDFGIARLLDEGDADQTQTLAMTPAWAAPEQLRGEPATTSADIYQLGLLLRALLCGTAGTPESRGKRMSAGLLALEHADPKAAASTARARGTTPKSLVARMRGDLDAIVQRATREAPGERYASVDAFSEDLDRWAAHRPLHGAHDSWVARTGKFVRRNRVAVAATMLATVLVGVAGMFAWQQHAQQAREARMTSMSIVLADEILNALKPDRLNGKPLTADALLDGVVASLPVVRGNFPDDPVAIASLQSLIASKYLDLGRYDKAAPLLMASLDGMRPQRERFPDIWSHTVNYATYSLLELRHPAAARQLAEEELARVGRDGNANPLTTAALWRTESQALSAAGEHARAISALTQGMQLLEGLQTPEAYRVHADLQCERGVALSIARRDQEAEQSLLACLAERSRLPSTSHSPTNDLVTLGTLGDVYARTRRSENAEDAYFRAMDGLEHRVGISHPRASLFRLKWASQAAMNGHPEMPIERLRAAQIAMTAPGADSQRRAREAVALAQAQLVAFRPSDALQTLVAARAPLLDSPKVNPEFRWQFAEAWADALYESGRYAEARSAFETSRAMAATLQATAKTLVDTEVWRARQASDASQIALCEWGLGAHDAAVADAAQAWLDSRQARTTTQRIQERTRIHWRWLVAMQRPSSESLAALASLRRSSAHMVKNPAHPNVFRFDRMLSVAAQAAGLAIPPSARMPAASAGIGRLSGQTSPLVAPGLSVF